MNFNIVKSKSNKPLFWEHEEYTSFLARKYNKVDYSRFLSVLEDYYMLTYSGRLSRNAWLVFCWIKYMSKKDGFVYASYESIISTYCNGGIKISKPTFFKCIGELENNDLIISINTTSNNLKSCNIYALIDKSHYVYDLCNVMDLNPAMNTSEAMIILERNYTTKKRLFDLPDTEVNKKKSKIPDDKKYELLMKTTFKPIQKEIGEMFEFIGSFNVSKRIAISRKAKILLTLKEYLEVDGFDLNTIVYAITIMMKNTRNGKNPYRERYMFKILENMLVYEDEVESENDVADKLSKKAEEKINKLYNSEKKSNQSVTVKSVIKTKEQYDDEKGKLMNVEGYYKTFLNKLNPSALNKSETKLYKLAIYIKKKFDDYDANSHASLLRIKAMRKRNCFEFVEFDNKWNRIISWEDSDGNPITKKKAFAYFKEDGIAVEFSPYDIISGG